MVVQCSGSRFPSAVQRMSPMTGALSAFLGKGYIVKRTALRALIQSMQQRCRGSLRHYISRVLQYLFLEIPHFTMESAERFGDFSLETLGSVTSILCIPISTYPSTEVTENVFDFRLGTPYTNSGHCRLAFLQHLGYSPRL